MHTNKLDICINVVEMLSITRQTKNCKNDFKCMIVPMSQLLNFTVKLYWNERGFKKVIIILKNVF